ncbi:hypothetical protein [Pseudomonas sp. Ant30-3]|nr:hypothetical protein [Pseudomonas sp. Ant30-3]
MSGSDGTGNIITALDKAAFAASAGLAASPLRGYQQGFIHLERLS